jgi:hypothetical protein
MRLEMNKNDSGAIKPVLMLLGAISLFAIAGCNLGP